MNPHAPPRNDPSATPYALDAASVLDSLGCDRQRGLTASQVSERIARFGHNQLAEEPPVPLWRKFFRQFQELVVLILIAAAIVSGAVGDWTDTAAIMSIVLLNAIIGFLQEERAERGLAALQKLSTPVAKVIRDGVLQSVPAQDLVPGELVELAAGDYVPADARLIDGFGFRVQEAALTGESEPVDKEPNETLHGAIPLGDRRNMVYMGTVAAAGKAHAVVVATGMHTELGHIAGMLQREEPEPTPLQRRLAELGRVLLVIIVVLVAVFFALQMLRGGPSLELIMLSVSLAVAAIPEGLPAVVTIALALGLSRMVKRNVLIRKLPSVETLGSVTVICSDKTGTLTRNEMTVREILTGGECYQVTGAGYTPRGEFLNSQSIPVNPTGEPDLPQALTIAARCNDAKVSPHGLAADTWQVIGDPTEGALLVAALKAAIEGKNHRHHVLYEIPFDSERKMMSVVVREPDVGAVMYSKGAPEVILGKCEAERRGGQLVPLTDGRRREIMQANADMAARALRVLALAYRDHMDVGHAVYEEADLVFAGLVGMIDPPREEVKEAVYRCREAGIRPVMITGDHPATALAIARDLQLTADSDRVVTGQELNAMSDAELAAQVDQISVYARVSAEHKLRVVRAWKARGQVVAMTGDGVNDAPAVKAADIGIAMGVTGTDVTKEASDMVLMDDNFVSIVNAVEEGRGIFDNIQKFLQYLLAGNVGLVLFMFFAALVGWPLPLLAIQILWINLVTNGFPALGLAMEPPERDLMRRPPRPPHEPVITLRRGGLMMAHGFLFAIVAALAFWLVFQGDDSRLARARSVVFCVVSLSFTFYSLACRSQRYTMPEIGLFSNPHLFAAIAFSMLFQLAVVTLPFAQSVFEVATHLTWEWLLVFLFALVPVTIVELVKIVRSFLRGPNASSNR